MGDIPLQVEDASQLETQAGQDGGSDGDGEQAEDAPQPANGAQKPPPGQQAPADEADPDPEVTRVSDNLLSRCFVTVAQHLLRGAGRRCILGTAAAIPEP